MIWCLILFKKIRCSSRFKSIGLFCRQGFDLCTLKIEVSESADLLKVQDEVLVKVRGLLFFISHWFYAYLEFGDNDMHGPTDVFGIGVSNKVEFCLVGQPLRLGKYQYSSDLSVIPVDLMSISNS